MSITINIKYFGESDNAVKFADEMISSGIVDEIRNEKGNLRYEYYFNYSNTDEVLLIDEWENQEALDLHHESAAMQKIINLRNKYNLKMEVERFEKIDNNPKDTKYIK